MSSTIEGENGSVKGSSVDSGALSPGCVNGLSTDTGRGRAAAVDAVCVLTRH